MHPLHESRKAVVGDAGVLCGVIGRRGSILVITHLPIAWGGRLDYAAQVYWRHGTTRLGSMVTSSKHLFRSQLIEENDTFQE